MNRGLLVLTGLLLLLSLAAGCSSPAKMQRQATEEYILSSNALEFEKLCTNAVKTGMTRQEVLFQWGSPVSTKQKEIDGKKAVIMTFEIGKIMYFRGWNRSEGVSKGHMSATLIDGQVTEITRK
ncbi:hypothetical protein [Dethiosulfatarculus sandiegensis]|uniref:Lipoprotein n=1 Tax=Dethiosulfatarculus sandiegensis TaxID=1429043 RepID=A0A0D2HK38_9BACT|nr:hypothetical protein [Dethiosulfatarculus sandiegensis]KIX10998.1 hypothetical protein X474_26970 [Dethiosulfatarculus sandiegensis]